MAKKISSKNGSGLVRVLVAASSAVRRAGLEAAVKAAPRLKLVGSASALGATSTPAISAQAVLNPAILSPALLAQVRALEPDVLLLDLDHADHHFFDVFAKLSFPEATGPAIVVLVDGATPAWTAHALRNGVKAILLRDAPMHGFPTDDVPTRGAPLRIARLHDAPMRDAPRGDPTLRAVRRAGTGVGTIPDLPTSDIVSAIHAAYAGFVLLDSALAQDLAHHVPAEASRIHVEASRAHAEASDDDAFDELTARETEILRMLAEGLGNRQIAVALGISEHTVKFHISSILDKLGASTRTEAVTSGIRMGLIFV